VIENISVRRDNCVRNVYIPYYETHSIKNDLTIRRRIVCCWVLICFLFLLCINLVFPERKELGDTDGEFNFQ